MDVEKEVVGGLKNTGLYLGGMFLGFAGFFALFFNKIVGNVLWLGGLAMIVYSIVRGYKQQPGSGFQVANMVMKIIVILLLLAMGITANFYPG